MDGLPGLRISPKLVATFVICSQLSVAFAAACCLPQHGTLPQEQTAACPMHKTPEETCSMSACPMHRAVLPASHHQVQQDQNTAGPTPASSRQVSCNTDDFSISDLIGPDKMLGDSNKVTLHTRHLALEILFLRKPITRNKPVLIQPPRA